MARTMQKLQKPQKPQKRTKRSINLKRNRDKCFENLIEAKKILSLLSSGKITRDEALRLLGSLSMLLMNTHSRITNPLIPIEPLLNELKIHLIIAQMNFSNILVHVEAINSMIFITSTFDEMSRSAFELLQHCSTIESLITQIESSFGMIRMILEQIPEESFQRLVESIQAFRDTFDQFVNEFSQKNEELLKFLNSAKEAIDLMILHSEKASTLELKIQEVGSSLLTASSNQRLIEFRLRSLQKEQTENKTNMFALTDSMKRLIEDYVRTQHDRQIECPTSRDIDSILRAMSSISPRFELYRQSDDSPTARTYEQNLFDARIKKGLDMIHAKTLCVKTHKVFAKSAHILQFCSIVATNAFLKIHEMDFYKF
jgi:hypothetical protein